MPIRLLASSGRVIGLYPDGSDENFLWTNTGASGAWPNPGGDRTWLAPEIELFISDLNDCAGTYRVPAALDPGHWQLNGGNRLVNSTRLRLHRSGRDAAVRLEKEILPAANPLPDAKLQYAGYTQVTRLETDAPLGIWNLLQFPQPGTMLIPTRTAAGPRLVFGECTADELTTTAGLIRWNMAAPGSDAKIAIKAEASTGRVGYLRETATPGIWDLVVREFAVDPAGNYVDALWESPHETGWAFQACCVRNGAALFNELEYHAPANRRPDESRVWAFRGSFAAINAAAATLLERKITNR